MKNILVLLVLILPAFAWFLKPGFFPVHDDLQAMRQLQMDKCFMERQIPCRWVPDMGYGFGYPLFNYYPPLPYLIGQPFRSLGFQYIDTVKIVGILGFVVCALFMYLLGKEFFGVRGGLLASLFYTYAPYHAVDYWVRGAVNEFFAMAFYPAILLTLYLVIKTGHKKYIPLSALSIAGLMLSHNLMLLIFFPIAILWVLFWLIKLNKLDNLTSVHLLISGTLALGLSAFFTLPVIFEAKYAHIETLTMGYFNYLAHFLNWRQIFIIPNWGYGSSELGPADGMSFFLGYFHWIVPTIIIIGSLFIKKMKPYRNFLHLLLILLIASLYFTHNKSTFFWDNLMPLQNLQFPWRFLTISAFLASFISAAAAKIIPNKIILISLIISLLILNGNYFRPRLWLNDWTDKKEFSGAKWLRLQNSGIFDYLPKSAKAPPGDPVGDDLNIIQGQGTWETISKKSNLQKYQLNIQSDKAVAEVQTIYFPGWTAYLNDQKVTIDPTRDPLLGRIQIDLPSGQNTITLKFLNTPIRTFSNLLSVIAWFCIIAVWIHGWMKSWIWRPSNQEASRV